MKRSAEPDVSAITGRPAWAVLSTSGLRALDFPDTPAREVIVLADSDDPGDGGNQTWTGL